MRVKTIGIAVSLCAVGALAKEKAVDMSRHGKTSATCALLIKTDTKPFQPSINLEQLWIESWLTSSYVYTCIPYDQEPSRRTNRYQEQWEAKLASGALNSTQWPRLNYTKCVNGIAEAIHADALQTFRCKNMDLYDFINHATLGSPLATDEGASGSSIWGWTDPKSDREFIGRFIWMGRQSDQARNTY